MSMQTYKKVLTAVGDKMEGQFSPALGFMEVVAAAGVLTVSLAGGGGTVSCIQGDVLFFDPKSPRPQGFALSSSVAGDNVEIRAGKGWSIRFPNAFSSVVQAFNSVAGITGNVNNIATVGGVVNFGTTTTIGGAGPPVPVSMYHDNGDGTFTSHPLQTDDNQTLLVQPGINIQVGFVFGVPTLNYPVKDVQSVRVWVDSADVTPMQVTDQYGHPVTIYPQDGSACIPSGQFPAAYAGYYLCTAGITFLNFTGSGAWSFHAATGPQAFIPRLG